MSEIDFVRPTKVVMCHGVFDVLHRGHLDLFKVAESLGDYIIVSLVSDRFVDKGPGRPVNTEQDRMDMLMELRMVDKVVLTKDVFPFDNIRSYKPDVYVRGREDCQLPEQALLDDLGIEVVFIDKDTHSSTVIIERIGL